MIDDSTTKNTRLSRLLNREFIPKTEHLDLKQLWVTLTFDSAFR